MPCHPFPRSRDLAVKLEHVLAFAAAMTAAWFVALYSWPRLLLSVFKRAILVKGFGDGPIPVNSLYLQSQASFADPLRARAGSQLATTGVNRDTLVSAGWLDLREGPLLLHVPAAGDRYYSVQFTDPSTNTNFAYVGTRTTGARAGDFLITGPRWAGEVPSGMRQISSPPQLGPGRRPHARLLRQRPAGRARPGEPDAALGPRRTPSAAVRRQPDSVLVRASEEVHDPGKVARTGVGGAR